MGSIWERMRQFLSSTECPVLRHLLATFPEFGLLCFDGFWRPDQILQLSCSP